MGKTAVQMKRGGCFGKSGIAGGNGFGNGCVFRGCGCKPGGVIGGQPPDPNKVHPKAAHGLGQVRVRDGRLNGLIQPANQPVVIMTGRIAIIDEPRRGQQLFLQLPENC